ncbi:hypothetical protein [Poseidonocella sedimentorum]|uniref:GYD domain-containing protein n=1 Tax=Poseidonocella sedimentorum TaxID=871652 RepID=A0A1I6DA67_9RHOB|nr:hypothetical protein [Poseidonocella sedimentorum]SFR02324.1 hypothetical protein SAMN04515673_102495 [Poseidonocella sedimentorum]
MTLQLLCSFTATDDGWQAAYDQSAETRAQAGLTQLQLWRAADEPGTVWALYGVNDRAKAQGWLDGAAQLSGGRVASASFLTTL